MQAETLAAMRQSILDGAPDEAARLAKQALEQGIAPLDIEKLVIDAESIASAQRLLDGIEPRTEELAISMFAQIGLHGDFLKLKETRALFRKEQHFPSSVIDRGADPAAPDLITRACQRVNELLESYRRQAISPEGEKELLTIALSRANAAGLDHLPGIELHENVASKL